VTNRTGELLPEFTVQLLNGAMWRSQDQPAGTMSLLTIYRGMWCGQCKKQLQALERLHDEFALRGVDVVAVSADTETRARSMANDYALHKLNIGFDVSIAAQERWAYLFPSKRKPLKCHCFVSRQHF